MDLVGDDRGQAIQVGAVLLFAMLIVAMSVYQAQVVPSENAEIEFDSYLDASTDMANLRNDMLTVAATDTRRGTTLTTGVLYPVRVFFVNPGPATGRLTTGEPETLAISNVKSVGTHPNVDVYLQSEGSSLEYTTRDVTFFPSYNEIDVAPVVVANGFTYRNYSTPIPLTTQTIIQGNRLTFVTVEGELDAGGVSTTVTIEPVSAHTRTVTVTNRTADPLVVTIPTPIPASTWESEILAGQLDPAGTFPNRYVTGVAPGPVANSVNVTLEPGANYELRIARIELHERGRISEAGVPSARYLVAITDTDTQTSNDGRVALTVEARDRFNNPVSDTNVTFVQPSGLGTFETELGAIVDFPIRTNENGRVTVYYNATGHLGDIPVVAYLGTTPAEDETDVEFSIFNNVIAGGGGGSGEQAGRALVVLSNSFGVIDPDKKKIKIEIDNTGDFAVNVTGYRLDYATAIDTNGDLLDGANSITSIELCTGMGCLAREGTATESRSPYFLIDPIPLDPGTSTLTVTFDGSLTDGSKSVNSLMVSFGIYLEGNLTVTFTLHILLS